LTKLREILSLQDFENAARWRLPKSVFGFVAGGAEDARSLRRRRRISRSLRRLP
jgi:L-lactate dehydrogenase (cytochrome)